MRFPSVILSNLAALFILLLTLHCTVHIITYIVTYIINSKYIRFLGPVLEFRLSRLKTTITTTTTTTRMVLL